MAIAQLHKQLYSDDVSSVSLNDYLETVVGDLRRSASDEITIALRLPAEKVELTPDHALAIGITITELVLNALKHAYPDGKGPVRIELRAENAQWMSIVVEDDGVGRDRRYKAGNGGLDRPSSPPWRASSTPNGATTRRIPERVTLRIRRRAMEQQKASPAPESAERAA